MIRKWKDKMPDIAEGVFVDETAVVVGDVKIGSGSSIWCGAVIRGDENSIEIGEGTNIQDNCVLHCPPNLPLVIGNSVTIGHAAILHGCIIHSNVLIGMGAIVMDGAEVGEGAVVAAGSVVVEGTKVPPASMVAGIPATVKKTLKGDIVERIKQSARLYQKLAEEHKNAK